jgi:hypothetical protein
MNRSLLAVILVSLIPSCVIFPHYDRLAGKISGSVVDSQGRPISGAKVEFIFRSKRVLGVTDTSRSGLFDLGPFRQWFYVAYIGSPGICPFPYTLENHGLPHVLRVSHGSSTAIYMLGNESDFRKQNSADYPGIRIDLPRSRRWAGSERPVKLILSPDMHDSALPKHSRRDLPKPVIFPTQP